VEEERKPGKRQRGRKRTRRKGISQKAVLFTNVT